VAFVKQLIVNADDFGLHELINEGIIEGHNNGCITSTSIMAGGNAFEHAVTSIRQYPQLGVGVHLTLIGAKPVARANICSLLTREGIFFSSYREFVQKYLLGLISKEHIEYELRCQMRKVAGRGIVISHVDSHQHLHCLPGMVSIVSKIAKEFGVRKVRISAEPLSYLGSKPLNITRLAEKTILSACAIFAKHGYNKLGLYSPHNFYGMLAGGSMSEAELYHIICNVPDGVSEIMVHPGRDTSSLNQVLNWNYNWQEELQALKSHVVMDAIRKSNIHLINYHKF
jgi:hopanoid biosynthesis associated protein HpnK